MMSMILEGKRDGEYILIILQQTHGKIIDDIEDVVDVRVLLPQLENLFWLFYSPSY